MVRFIKFSLLLAIFNLSEKGVAQEIEWQNSIGGNAPEVLHSVDQTTDGGYIIGGYSSSNISGDKTENSIGNADYWIVKTDANGNIQWQNTIGGLENDYLYDIEQTMDGGYIMCGSSLSDSSGDKTANTFGPAVDYWIVKTDSIGVVQWDKTFGGDLGDVCQSIAQTPDGGYIMGGWSASGISGNKTAPQYGTTFDYWIVKTDSLGNILWDKSYGGVDGEYFYEVLPTNDGGYILGGQSSSDVSGNKTDSSNGGNDYWVIKTDSLGNIQWQNSIGGSNDDNLSSVALTSDNGFILGGISSSGISGDKTEFSNVFYDYWIVKIDSSGSIEWDKTYRGADYDNMTSVAQTADNGYILGGWSKSNVGEAKTENTNGVRDLWIIKTDSIGTVSWQNTIGSSGEDYLTSISQTQDGGIIVGGYSSALISGDKTENSYGFSDYWLIKLTSIYNGITGKLYIDANLNNTHDTGEHLLTNKKVTESNTGRFNFSDHNGNFLTSVLTPGNFSIAPADLNYYTPNPLNHAVTFTNMLQTDSLNDFAFQPSGTVNDLGICMNPYGGFRAGFYAHYCLASTNTGTTTLNPTVVFYPDPALTFTSSNPVPDAITPDSIVWQIGNLVPFEENKIYVTVSVNLGTFNGYVVSSSTSILPVIGDATTTNNTAFRNAIVTGSYDPNDINVDIDTLYTTQIPNPPYLDYLIRFQNTGTDTAFTVKILNPIDTTKLDISSLELITSSHPVSLNWINYERNLQFQFDNILLPDSNVNELESHGFVRYKILPKTNLTAGKTINNNCAIYFDFNSPVITNTAITRVVLQTGLPEFHHNDRMFEFFPNPADETISIFIGNILPENSLLEITDVTGKKVYQNQNILPEQQMVIPLYNFDNGIYLIKLTGVSGTQTEKLVKY